MLPVAAAARTALPENPVGVLRAREHKGRQPRPSDATTKWREDDIIDFQEETFPCTQVPVVYRNLQSSESVFNNISNPCVRLER